MHFHNNLSSSSSSPTKSSPPPPKPQQPQSQPYSKLEFEAQITMLKTTTTPITTKPSLPPPNI
ncbi:hypothetical protein HKD37_13G037342 [Glycine soja]